MAVAESRRAHLLSFVNEEGVDVPSATDEEFIRKALERAALGEAIHGATKLPANRKPL